MQKSLFIFGLGYTSQVLARAAMAQGFSVAGTVRSNEKCASLNESGIKTFLFDAIPQEILENSTHILSSIPPQEGGDVAITLLPEGDRWLGYFSTTGVYGDYGGEWVDEKSTPRPNNQRLIRRLEAEKQWQERGGHIFRLAGIYGAERNAINDVRAGKAQRIYKEGQVFSRIHVDDIAQTVLASMMQPNPRAIYNVCDDEPVPAYEVVAFACKLLGVEELPLIPFEQANLSAMGREFYSANRRVRNQRIKQELGVKLLYPSYKDGLKGVLNSCSEKIQKILPII